MAKRIKVILTKAGTAYDASRAYQLHDYIIIDNTTMYVCKRVDKTTMTSVGHALTETDWWDKCIDMADALKKINDAVSKADTASANAATATSKANSAADKANAATTEATNATSAANAAADVAQTAATKADTATSKANDAATAATKAAANVNATINGSTLEVTQADGTKKTLSLAEQTETKATLDSMAEKNTEQDSRLASLEQAVGDMGGTTGNYYCASQDTSQASPDLVNPQTNTSVQILQDLYRPFLVNHEEAKEGVEVMPAYELMRNNWLRYKNGKFAPAVGITEEMRAQCDVELYLDEEHTQKYCDAGKFDAEKFYNEYGFGQKLYDAEGNEIAHVLRPWETISKNYSVMVGDPSGTYLIDDYSSKDGEHGIMYKGIMKSYREVAGIKPKYLAPTLLSPCQATSIKGTDGKIRFRSFPFLYNPGDTNTQGGKNATYNITMFMEQGAYPRVNDVHQDTSATYARNNNADAKKSYPFAETGFHAYNTFLIAHELLYGTNYIANPDTLFSSGTSAVDACTNEAQWRKYGGVRYRPGDTGNYSYAGWNTSGMPIYSDAKGTKVSGTMSEFLNSIYPKWREMEAQLVLSVAAERGVAEDTDFDVYGTTYRYVTPAKAKGLADGYMNAIVYRVVKGQYQGHDASGNAVTWQFEASLRQGVMDGMVTCGDIMHYRGGGYEQVATNHYTSNTGQNGGNDMDLYLETDQRKWLAQTTSSKDNLGTWDFESAYEHIAHITGVTTGWAKQRFGFTGFMKAAGGGRNSYQCYYNDNSNWYSSKPDQRVRCAVRFGGDANWTPAAPRSLNASTPARFGVRYFGGSAQCLFVVAQPQ